MHQTTAIMGEKELINDILNQEKQIVSLYSNAITESSCTNMRQILMNNFEQSCQDQYTVFNEMVNKGFYQTKQANPNDVQQAKQKFSQMQSNL